MSYHIPAHKSGTAGQVPGGFDDLPVSEPLDFQRVSYVSRLTLLYPRTERARAYCAERLSENAREGSAYIVEECDIASVWADIVDADFNVWSAA